VAGAPLSEWSQVRAPFFGPMPILVPGDLIAAMSFGQDRKLQKKQLSLELMNFWAEISL